MPKNIFIFILCIFLASCSTVSSPMPPLETPKYQSAKYESGSPERSAPSIVGDTTFVWPLKDGVVTQEFRLRKGRKKGHKGIDIAAPKGDEVFAAHDGLVIFAGRRFHGFGQLVIIENDRGDWATFYSHLQKIKTRQGRRVAQGELIGNVGRTGRATGYHLHFEVRHNKGPVNPLSVLP